MHRLALRKTPTSTQAPTNRHCTNHKARYCTKQEKHALSNLNSVEARRQFLLSVVNSSTNANQPPNYSSLYKLSKEQIIKAGGGSVLSMFGGSIFKMLKTTFPEHDWKPWCMQKTPRNYWNKLADDFFRGDPNAKEEVMAYLEELADEYNVKSLSDWEHVATHLGSHKHLYRLAHFGSLGNLLRTLYPTHNWQIPQQELNVPMGSYHIQAVNVSLTDLISHKREVDNYWLSPQHRRQYFVQYIASHAQEKECTNNYELLYKLKLFYIVRTKGRALLNLYNGSHSFAIMTEFPEIHWKPWKFDKSPRNWWELLGTVFQQSGGGDIVAQTTLREYIDDLANQYNIRDLDDWMRHGAKVFAAEPESRLPRIGSLTTILSVLYPHHFQQQPQFAQTPSIVKFSDTPLPNNFFNDPSNRRKYLDFLKAQLGGTFESLYNATFADALRTGGSALLRQYNGSLSMAIMDIYANDFEWKAWKFRVSPTQWWVDLATKFWRGEKLAIDTVREYLLEIAPDLNKSSDWRSIRSKYSTLTHLARLKHLGPLSEVLRVVFPETDWRVAGEYEMTAHMMAEYDNKPQVYWDSPQNRWNYLSKLVKALNVTSPNQLYNIDSLTLIRNGGEKLLRVYSNSASALLTVELADHPWKRWNFPLTKTLAWWNNLASLFRQNDPVAVTVVREWVDDLAVMLKLKTLEDWYRVKPSALGTANYLRIKLFGLAPLLMTLYPQHAWNTGAFTYYTKAKTTQAKLARRIAKSLI